MHGVFTNLDGVIVDPYTMIWVSLGWEPRDPFDPEVEDNEQAETKCTEGGEGEGWGDNQGEMPKSCSGFIFICLVMPSNDSVSTVGHGYRG